MMQYIAFAIYRDTKRSALITTSMMNAVRGANAKYLQELEEEKKKKRKAQEEAEAAAEAKIRKNEIDLAKKTWGEKREDLKNQTKSVWLRNR